MGTTNTPQVIVLSFQENYTHGLVQHVTCGDWFLSLKPFRVTPFVVLFALLCDVGPGRAIESFVGTEHMEVCVCDGFRGLVKQTNKQTLIHA